MIFSFINRVLILCLFSVCTNFCQPLDNIDSSSSSNLAKVEKTFVILVHGTFAANSSWHANNGPFFLELKKYCQRANMDFAIESYIWSGALSANGRLQGAIGLAKRIMQIKEGCPNSKIICIGHSHGGNVILMASQMLFISKTAISLVDFDISRGFVWSLIAQDLFYPIYEHSQDSRSIETDSDPMLETINKISEIELAANMIKEFLTRGASSKEVYKIDEAYLLGTPINPKVYAPCSESIGTIYSLYSTIDMVQVYSPIYKRRFIEYGPLGQYLPAQIFEFKIELFCNQSDKTVHNPGHLELNDGWMGAGLLSLPCSTKLTTVVLDAKDQCQFCVKFYKDGSCLPKVFFL